MTVVADSDDDDDDSDSYIPNLFAEGAYNGPVELTYDAVTPEKAIEKMYFLRNTTHEVREEEYVPFLVNRTLTPGESVIASVPIDDELLAKKV